MKLLNVDTVAEANEKLDLHFKKDVGNSTRNIEEIDISQAIFRYLASPLVSDINVPQFRRSIVDGYALISKDTFGATESIPAFLKVIGESEMGKECHLSLEQGEAIYVPTGAMLPQNADSVVMIEYVEKMDEENICVYKTASINQGFMNIGEDFSEGDKFGDAGHRITPKDIGILAACVYEKVKVFKKPKIGLISTGDEIINVSKKPMLGEIRDINSNIIRAFIDEMGGEITEIRIVKDEFQVFKKIFEEMLEVCDLILISGGSSAGNKDFTKDIIDACALPNEPGSFTHGIAIKPGKPTIIGKVFGKPVFGLPGHPLSATIVYKILVEPFIKRYYFGNLESGLAVKARVKENFHSGEGRETYQLVNLVKTKDEYEAIALLGKSGSISQLFKADGYIRIDSLNEGIKSGEITEVYLF